MLGIVTLTVTSEAQQLQTAVINVCGPGAVRAGLEVVNDLPTSSFRVLR